MEYAIVALIAYLLGSIPFALVVVKAVKGVDIRTIGSGNVGATNAYRAAGIVWAIIIFLLDMAKGFVSAFVPKLLFPDLTPWVTIVGALCVILGHLFPIWLKFKGGKGAATGLGVLFALAWLPAATGFAVWFVVMKVSRYVSLATIVTAVYVAVFSFLYYTSPNEQTINYFIAVLCALVIVMHRSNIRRLIKGEENKV